MATADRRHDRTNRGDCSTPAPERLPITAGAGTEQRLVAESRNNYASEGTVEVLPRFLGKFQRGHQGRSHPRIGDVGHSRPALSIRASL